MAHYRDFVEHYAGLEQAEDFAMWAFGPGFKNISGGDIWKEWNKLHGDLYTIVGSNKPDDDIPKMVCIWRKYKPNWIPVSERLPEEDKRVLLSWKDRVEVGMYLGEDLGFLLPDVAYMAFQATHWMELPQPAEPESTIRTVDMSKNLTNLNI